MSRLFRIRASNKGMAKLREIAVAHLAVAPEELKQSAHNFFNSMDDDGDGQVNLSEFLTFMQEEGHAHLTNRDVFKQVDSDGNGFLDFMEVMTVYYIIRSGRPVCGMCANIIPDIFFTCMGCFQPPSGSNYSLCFNCYHGDKCSHKHNGRRYHFLDNYTLLEAKINSGPPSWIHEPRTSVQQMSQTSTASTSIAGGTTRRDRIKVAFRAFEALIGVTGIGVSLCTTM